MHFEILVEDISGKTALEILVPKIIDLKEHTLRIHSYRGAGRLPKGLQPKSDPRKRILLDQLPRLIQGYGKTFSASNSSVALIIVCDLDDRCLSAFRKELLDCVNKCDPKPETYFCIAIEEGEAWYLGDLEAVKAAYPNAKFSTLNAYINDSICGTWEKLADALKVSKSSTQIGKEKLNWAKTICPLMDVDKNHSPSFCYFRDRLRSLSKRNNASA